MREAPRVVDLPPVHAVAVRGKVPASDLAVFFGDAYRQLYQLAGERGATIVGMPFARYFSVTPGEVDVEAAVPVVALPPLSLPSRIYWIDLPGGPAVELRHIGPYWTMTDSYAALERWLDEHHRAGVDVPREVYLNGPEDTEPEDWVTLIVQPVEPAQPAVQTAA